MQQSENEESSGPGDGLHSEVLDGSTSGRELPTCSCGHDRAHFSVSARPEFTAWGWFWNLFGLTAHPTRLRFICRVCGEEIEILDKREEISRYW